MQRLLYASVIAMALGCGQVTPPMEEISANVVAPEPVKSPAVMSPVQRTVTAFDGKGQPHQVTVTETQPFPTAPAMRGEKAPLPKAKVDPPTLEKVGAEFDQAVREIEEAVNRETREDRVTKIYLPLIERLKGVQERTKKPDCNLAREQAEIRAIRAALRQQISKPRKTLPPPKEGKD